MQAICTLLLTSATFANTIDINYGVRTGEEHLSFDLQVQVKLLLAIACSVVGGLGFLLSRQVRHVLFGLPGILLVALSLVLLATSGVALPEVAKAF